MTCNSLLAQLTRLTSLAVVVGDVLKYLDMRHLRGALRWSGLSFHRSFATASSSSPKTPQTVIEKVVQKYAVGLPPGKVVRAGDYVMIQPEHVMTHDNTGPVISKCVNYDYFPTITWLIHL